MLFDAKTAPLKAAMQLDALGFVYNADQLYQGVIAANGDDAEKASILRRKMYKRIEIEDETEEPEWSFLSTGEQRDIGFLLNIFKNVNYKYFNNADISLLSKNVIYKPTDFGDASMELAERLFQRSTRLVVLAGDEWYRDDERKANKYADLVIRTFHSIFMEQDRSILQIPLGWRAPDYVEWPETAPRKTIFDRGYLWSFVGESEKSTRPAMLANMRQVGFGFEHLACGYHADNILSTRDYRHVMEETIFAPCPAGWANLESYRVWEALEAGCIPIVEKRRGLDFFTRLAGPHPMLVVEDWSEVPALLTGLGDASEIEILRLTCESWWAGYKDRLADQVATAMRACG